MHLVANSVRPESHTPRGQLNSQYFVMLQEYQNENKEKYESKMGNKDKTKTEKMCVCVCVCVRTRVCVF